MKNHYKTLGVEKSASQKEIKNAYRKLAMEFHPDKNPGNKEAEEKFKEISAAYEILGDDNKRNHYDTYGDTSQRQHQHYSDIEDIMKNMGFGMGFEDLFSGRHKKQKVRGQDLHKKITIEFLEAANGCDKAFHIEYPVGCSDCSNTGAKDGKKIKTCNKCNGSGKIAYKQGFIQMINTCAHCKGRGFEIVEICSICRGQGHVNKEEKLKINIPSGVDENTTIRLSGKGLPSEVGFENGDLFISLNIKSHSKFKRMGNNIQTDEEIGYIDAILGSNIKVETIHGFVDFNIPPGTQPNHIFKIKQKGIKKDKFYGDHMVNVKVKIPKNISDEEKSMLIKIQNNKV